MLPQEETEGTSQQSGFRRSQTKPFCCSSERISAMHLFDRYWTILSENSFTLKSSVALVCLQALTTKKMPHYDPKSVFCDYLTVTGCTWTSFV